MKTGKVRTALAAGPVSESVARNRCDIPLIGQRSLLMAIPIFSTMYGFWIS